MRSDNDILYANDGLNMTVVYTLCTLQERVIKLTMSFNNIELNVLTTVILIILVHAPLVV